MMPFVPSLKDFKEQKSQTLPKHKRIILIQLFFNNLLNLTPAGLATVPGKFPKRTSPAGIRVLI